MRIAYLSQVYPPMISGAAIAVRQLADGMTAKGHRVLVVASSDRGPSYRANERGVEVVRLKSKANPLRVQSRISMVGRRPLEAAIRSFRPEIVHAHDPSQLGVLGLQYAKKAGISSLFTGHQIPGFAAAYIPVGGKPLETFERLLWWYGDWLTQQSDEVIVCSRAIAAEYKEHVGRDPLVIGYGVDHAYFTPRPSAASERDVLCQKYGLKPGLPVVLHVGRLDFDKKVHIVVEACARVLRGVRGQLLIVGDGTQRRKLRILADELGIGPQTIFTGYVDSTGDLAGLYRLGRVFVTASEIETQGLVLQEAMASGLPVVAVHATCIPEVVRHGVTGYLAPAGDVSSLGCYIRELLMNPVRAKRMGDNGRDLSEAFSLETTADMHEAVYERLIRGAHGQENTTRRSKNPEFS